MSLSNHQKNLTLNCPIRGARVLLIIPNDESLMFPPGFVNCVWLKMLKNSIRRSKARFSLIVVCFKRPKSVLLNPGPWKKRRLTFPNVPGVQFCANAPTLGKQAASTSPGNCGVKRPGGGGMK